MIRDVSPEDIPSSKSYDDVDNTDAEKSMIACRDIGKLHPISDVQYIASDSSKCNNGIMARRRGL